MSASEKYPPYGLSKFASGDRPGMQDWNSDNELITSALQAVEQKAVSFVVRGLYATLEELEAAHPTGEIGWAYAVGTDEDNTVYTWDVDALAWVNLGNLQGIPGADGKQGEQGEPGRDGLSEITDDTDTAISGVLVGEDGKVRAGVEGTDFAAAAHTHGSITSDGKIGDEAGLPVFTGTDGVLEVKTAGEALVVLGAASSSSVSALQKERLASNLTIYVSPTGNDTTGNGSSGAPYATIAKAKSMIPKNLGGFVARINLGAGTFTENTVFADYYGGSIEVFGQGVTTIIAGSVTFIRCTPLIGLMKIYTTAAYALTASDARLRINDDITIDCINKVGQGILAGNGSILIGEYGKTITINNSNSAIYASVSDVRIRSTVAGSNNNTGIVADACIVFAGTVTISATTAKTIYNNGQIYP